MIKEALDLTSIQTLRASKFKKSPVFHLSQKSTRFHLISTLVFIRNNNRKWYPIHRHPIYGESENHKIHLTLKLFCIEVNHFLRIHETLQDLTEPLEYHYEYQLSFCLHSREMPISRDFLLTESQLSQLSLVGGGGQWWGETLAKQRK